MKRTKAIGTVVALAAAAGIIATWSVHRPERAGAAAIPHGVTPDGKQQLAIAAGTHGELATRDVAGTLRLEGQVIDADDHPVGGARVTIDTLPALTVSTEGDGSFVFEHLLARHYTLVASSPEGVAGPLSVQPDAHGEPVIVRLRSPARFDVIAIDATTGSPIAGASVEVRAPIIAAATTGADGAAALAPVVPGHWPLVVAAPGYATAFDAVSASATERTKRTIALSRGMHARGRVVDRDGNPVADAVVWLERVSDWLATADPNRDGVHTASDGSFDVAGVGRGSYVAHAIAPDRATGTSAVTKIEADVAGIVLRTAPGVRITGKARHTDGGPASAATVRAAWPGPGGARLAHVDADGGFVLDGLPGETVWLVATDAEAASTPKRLDLSAPPPGAVDLVLENAAVISGTVVDHAGTPVEGAQVIGVYSGGLDQNANAVRQVEELSDSSGRFTLHGLAAGNYEVVATRDPFHGAPGKSSIIATGATDARLVVASSGAIKGRVAFKVGGAPAAYTVRVGRSGLATAFTGDTFQIEAQPGTRSLWIEGPGFTGTAVDGVAVTADGVADAGTIELDRGRTLRGRVTRADGGSLAAGEVVAGGLLAGTGQRVDTGDNGPDFRSDVKRASIAADGSFEITGAAPTTISVVASLPSGGRSAPVQVAAGTDDVGGLALVIKPEAALSGTVTRDGQPTRAIVNAQAQDSPLTIFTVMTSDGQYSFDQLAPGRYTVAAISGSPLAGSPFYPHAIELVAGKAATLDLTIAPGSSSLAVQVPGVTNGLVFVTTHPGAATSAMGLLNELGHQDGGQWAMAPVKSGAAQFGELAPGHARACVVAIPGTAAPSTSALVEAIVRSGGTLGATCAAVELSGATTVKLGGVGL